MRAAATVRRSLAVLLVPTVLPLAALPVALGSADGAGGEPVPTELAEKEIPAAHLAAYRSAARTCPGRLRAGALGGGSSMGLLRMQDTTHEHARDVPPPPPA